MLKLDSVGMRDVLPRETDVDEHDAHYIHGLRYQQTVLVLGFLTIFLLLVAHRLHLLEYDDPDVEVVVQSGMVQQQLLQLAQQPG